jgi:hypothetical protein
VPIRELYRRDAVNTAKALADRNHHWAMRDRSLSGEEDQPGVLTVIQTPSRDRELRGRRLLWRHRWWVRVSVVYHCLRYVFPGSDRGLGVESSAGRSWQWRHRWCGVAIVVGVVFGQSVVNPWSSEQRLGLDLCMLVRPDPMWAVWSGSGAWK